MLGVRPTADGNFIAKWNDGGVQFESTHSSDEVDGHFTVATTTAVPTNIITAATATATAITTATTAATATATAITTATTKSSGDEVMRDVEHAYTQPPASNDTDHGEDFELRMKLEE